jgi:hypothetical protein
VSSFNLPLSNEWASQSSPEEGEGSLLSRLQNPTLRDSVTNDCLALLLAAFHERYMGDDVNLNDADKKALAPMCESLIKELAERQDDPDLRKDVLRFVNSFRQKYGRELAGMRIPMGDISPALERVRTNKRNI